jgi:hypothetical protein
MILHARFEGVHAALIHSPCLTRSLILDERLAQSSHCIIITFSIVLYRCLFFHKFSSLSRSDHVENNNFHAWHMKFSFHQSIYSPPTDSNRVSYARSTPALQSVQIRFQTAHRSMFLSCLFVRVFKFIDLRCVGTDT